LPPALGRCGLLAAAGGLLLLLAAAVARVVWGINGVGFGSSSFWIIKSVGQASDRTITPVVS
jgi:hypothetical protein